MIHFKPIHLIALILFLLLIVLASNAHAEDKAIGHMSAGVCNFMDAEGNHYDTPSKCPNGLCCQDCGNGCVISAVPDNSLPGTPPVQNIILIDGGE